MSKNRRSASISRRSFIKGVGTGVAGSYLISPALKSAAKDISRSADESDGAELTLISLIVNGKRIIREVENNKTLASFLRDDLRLTGTKIICDHGECGGCTVLINKKPVNSCLFLAVDADSREVITIEGLMDGEKLHPLQQAFIDMDGLQCGYCTPGQIMSAYALLLENDNPSAEEIKEAMAGNICRCAAYPHIIESVERAASEMRNN